MTVIGTFAYCGSGQDTIALEIARKLDFRIYQMSEIVRIIAKERNLTPTRQALQNIRKEMDEMYGRDYFAKLLAKKVRSEEKNVIITGIRLFEEVDTFKKEFGEDFHLLFISAEESIRYTRLLNRNEEKDPKNYSEFLEQMKNESKLFDLKKLEMISDFRIDCNMNLDELRSGIDSIINSIPFISAKLYY